MRSPHTGHLFPFLLVLLAVHAYPCSFAHGYFYQVAELEGRVAGAKLGPLQYARWLRQSFTRNKVSLTLFEYRWPIHARTDMPLVKTIETDNRGRFQFGSLKPGHYPLIVDDHRWGTSDWFDIEITTLPHKAASVIIDISPHFPDCKGGHEIIAN
jgi:hypothetical protein